MEPRFYISMNYLDSSPWLLWLHCFGFKEVLLNYYFGFVNINCALLKNYILANQWNTMRANARDEQMRWQAYEISELSVTQSVCKVCHWVRKRISLCLGIRLNWQIMWYCANKRAALPQAWSKGDAIQWKMPISNNFGKFLVKLNSMEFFILQDFSEP